jgi:60 kDa SS-A/Ro ribonucleoprotein
MRTSGVAQWIVGRIDGVLHVPELLTAFERIQDESCLDNVLADIREHPSMPWEAVPTEWLKNERVVGALLPNMPVIATLRQLGRLTAADCLRPMTDNVRIVCDKLSEENIRKSKVHPIQVLSALTTYGSGHGARGSLTWTPTQSIMDRLDEAFGWSFKNVEPTGKRIYIGLDVSGSMGCCNIAGVPGLTPRNASAAMCLVTARTESNYVIRAFSGGMVPLNITARTSFEGAVGIVSGLRFGYTDCSLPMLDALANNIPVDAFIVYTDNETWAGTTHPSEALAKYRREMKIDAKLIVVGMTATGFSIADPQDAGMMDVVGFDSATPQIMADFIKNDA